MSHEASKLFEWQLSQLIPYFPAQSKQNYCKKSYRETTHFPSLSGNRTLSFTSVTSTGFSHALHHELPEKRAVPESHIGIADAFELNQGSTGLQEKSVKELWSMLDSQSEKNLSRKIDALQELVERKEPALESFLSKSLAEDNLEREWTFALIKAAELVEIVKEANRKRVCDALYQQALLLRDASDDASQSVLWAAIRRFASLVPIKNITEFLSFLRPRDRRTTRQMALQGLIHILTIEPLPINGQKVTDRVTSLAEKYLDSDWLISPENRVMAMNAFCAAALAGAPRLDLLTDRLLDLNEKRLAKRCYAKLSPALEHREDKHVKKLADCLSRLNRAQ